MVEIIPSDYLLARILYLRKKVSFKQIRKIRDKLLDCSPQLVVDISANSIHRAFENYPKLFSFGCVKKTAYVARTPQFKQYLDSGYIENEF